MTVKQNPFLMVVMIATSLGFLTETIFCVETTDIDVSDLGTSQRSSSPFKRPRSPLPQDNDQDDSRPRIRRFSSKKVPLSVPTSDMSSPSDTSDINATPVDAISAPSPLNPNPSISNLTHDKQAVRPLESPLKTLKPYENLSRAEFNKLKTALSFNERAQNIHELLLKEEMQKNILLKRWVTWGATHKRLSQLRADYSRKRVETVPLGKTVRGHADTYSRKLEHLVPQQAALHKEKNDIKTLEGQNYAIRKDTCEQRIKLQHDIASHNAKSNIRFQNLSADTEEIWQLVRQSLPFLFLRELYKNLEDAPLSLENVTEACEKARTFFQDHTLNDMLLCLQSNIFLPWKFSVCSMEYKSCVLKRIIDRFRYASDFLHPTTLSERCCEAFQILETISHYLPDTLWLEPAKSALDLPETDATDFNTLKIAAFQKAEQNLYAQMTGLFHHQHDLKGAKEKLEFLAQKYGFTLIPSVEKAPVGAISPNPLLEKSAPSLLPTQVNPPYHLNLKKVLTYELYEILYWLSEGLTTPLAEAKNLTEYLQNLTEPHVQIQGPRLYADTIKINWDSKTVREFVALIPTLQILVPPLEEDAWFTAKKQTWETLLKETLPLELRHLQTPSPRDVNSPEAQPESLSSLNFGPLTWNFRDEAAQPQDSVQSPQATQATPLRAPNRNPQNEDPNPLTPQEIEYYFGNQTENLSTYDSDSNMSFLEDETESFNPVTHENLKQTFTYELNQSLYTLSRGNATVDEETNSLLYWIESLTEQDFQGIDTNRSAETTEINWDSPAVQEFVALIPTLQILAPPLQEDAWFTAKKQTWETLLKETLPLEGDSPQAPSPRNVNSPETPPESLSSLNFGPLTWNFRNEAAQPQDSVQSPQATPLRAPNRNPQNEVTPQEIQRYLRDETRDETESFSPYDSDMPVFEDETDSFNPVTQEESTQEAQPEPLSAPNFGPLTWNVRDEVAQPQDSVQSPQATPLRAPTRNAQNEDPNPLTPQEIEYYFGNQTENLSTYDSDSNMSFPEDETENLNPVTQEESTQESPPLSRSSSPLEIPLEYWVDSESGLEERAESSSVPAATPAPSQAATPGVPSEPLKNPPHHVNLKNVLNYGLYRVLYKLSNKLTTVYEQVLLPVYVVNLTESYVEKVGPSLSGYTKEINWDSPAVQEFVGLIPALKNLVSSKQGDAWLEAKKQTLDTLLKEILPPSPHPQEPSPLDFDSPEKQPKNSVQSPQATPLPAPTRNAQNENSNPLTPQEIEYYFGNQTENLSTYDSDSNMSFPEDETENLNPVTQEESTQESPPLSSSSSPLGIHHKIALESLVTPESWPEERAESSSVPAATPAPSQPATPAPSRPASPGVPSEPLENPFEAWLQERTELTALTETTPAPSRPATPGVPSEPLENPLEAWLQERTELTAFTETTPKPSRPATPAPSRPATPGVPSEPLENPFEAWLQERAELTAFTETTPTPSQPATPKPSQPIASSNQESSTFQQSKPSSNTQSVNGPQKSSDKSQQDLPTPPSQKNLCPQGQKESLQNFENNKENLSLGDSRFHAKSFYIKRAQAPKSKPSDWAFPKNWEQQQRRPLNTVNTMMVPGLAPSFSTLTLSFKRLTIVAPLPRNKKPTTPATSKTQQKDSPVAGIALSHSGENTLSDDLHTPFQEHNNSLDTLDVADENPVSILLDILGC